jgi:hypothetical protein
MPTARGNAWARRRRPASAQGFLGHPGVCSRNSVIGETGAGAQTVCSWHGGKPGEIKLEDLPYIREEAGPRFGRRACSDSRRSLRLHPRQRAAEQAQMDGSCRSGRRPGWLARGDARARRRGRRVLAPDSASFDSASSARRRRCVALGHGRGTATARVRLAHEHRPLQIAGVAAVARPCLNPHPWSAIFFPCPHRPRSPQNARSARVALQTLPAVRASPCPRRLMFPTYRVLFEVALGLVFCWCLTPRMSEGRP